MLHPLQMNGSIRLTPFTVILFIVLCMYFLLSFPMLAAEKNHWPDHVETLFTSYPEAAFGVKRTNKGTAVTVNGYMVLFEPHGGCPEADPDQSLDPPVCATFSQTYPAGADARFPAVAFNPGRIRSEALLKALYGQDGDTVEANCVPVDFLGETVRFNQKQGAAASLERVVNKLESLVEKRPELVSYLLPTGGAFAWRTVEKSHRSSAHSFGIAIDLNVSKGPYWRWSTRESKEVRRAQSDYPQEIVDAFESEGFIWGGKWHAFDFMHFEYRPELLKSAQ